MDNPSLSSQSERVKIDINWFGTYILYMYIYIYYTYIIVAIFWY